MDLPASTIAASIASGLALAAIIGGIKLYGDHTAQKAKVEALETSHRALADVVNTQGHTLATVSGIPAMMVEVQKSVNELSRQSRRVGEAVAFIAGRMGKSFSMDTDEG